MGCGRAGFYSLDALDNANLRSAREVHPELQALTAGDLIGATPDGKAHFEVLRVEPPHLLALGGLYDRKGEQRLAFAAARPEHFWHVTWVFVLEPLDATTTRLHVRVRGAFSASELWHALWVRPVHELMQSAQLRHLKARVEGRLSRDDYHDVLEGIGGAAAMVLALLQPWRAEERSHLGSSESEAARSFEGDDLVPEPRWGFVHAIEIEAKAEEVWPWVAQLGADRGGFYSYQWLENLIGCEVQNAETIHPEWSLKEGDAFVLHPKQVPPMRVVRLEPGHHVLAHMPADEAARAAGKPWASASWLLLVEPLGERRCRVVSRHRSACSDDLRTRVLLGPALFEPISFAMDVRMLRGIKQRAESLHASVASQAQSGVT